MLCSLFPDAPVLALTATASKKDREVIKKSLNMVDVVEVVASPDRKNVYYEKVSCALHVFLSFKYHYTRLFKLSHLTFSVTTSTVSCT